MPTRAQRPAQQPGIVADATRITALAINADGRSRGYRGGDWVYAKDNARFRASLKR